MKLYNKSTNPFSHAYLNDDKETVYLILKPQKTLDVPDDIAELWLKYDGVEKYVAPEDIEKAAAEKAKEKEEEIKAKVKAEVQEEIDKLKAELEKAKAAAGKAAKKS